MSVQTLGNGNDLMQRTRIEETIEALMKQYSSTKPEPLLIMIKTATPPVFSLEVPAPDSVYTWLQVIRIANELGCQGSDVKGRLFVWKNQIPEWASETQKEMLGDIIKGIRPDFEAIANRHNETVENVGKQFWQLRHENIIRRRNIPIPVSITDVGQHWFFNTSSLIPILKIGGKETLVIAYKDRSRLLDVQTWKLGDFLDVGEDEPFRVYRSQETSGPARPDVAKSRSRNVMGYAAFTIGHKKELRHLLSFLENLGKWGAGRVSEVTVDAAPSRHVYPFFVRIGKESIAHRPVPLRYVPLEQWTFPVQGQVPVRGSRYMRSARTTQSCSLEGSILSSDKALSHLRIKFTPYDRIGRKQEGHRHSAAHVSESI
jgi:hypothetical protein